MIIRIWFKKIVAKIKIYLKPSAKKKPSVKYGFWCAIATIDRTTGFAYRIIPLPECGSYQWIITLDELGNLGGANLPTTRNLSRKYQINNQISKTQTHRFGVFTSGADGRVIPRAVWDVDLVNGRRGEFPKRAAKRAITEVAYTALRISHRPKKTYCMSWQGQIERMNWLGLLEEKIRWELGDSTHSLKEKSVYVRRV